jgi:ABC-type multidrug transport system fused ATPase/permease subunit
LGYLLGPLERLASVNLQIQEALLAIDRLYQVMDLEREPQGDDKVALQRVGQAIELKDVSFRYGCRAKVAAICAARSSWAWAEARRLSPVAKACSRSWSRRSGTRSASDEHRCYFFFPTEQCRAASAGGTPSRTPPPGMLE